MASIADKRVVDYTGLHIWQVQELDLISYRLYLRDAMIFLYSQTQEGRDYLDQCWRMEQTRPDRKSLAERFRKEGDR